MQTPDFLFVGAARAGTTSLHAYLDQHPQLFLPGNKEPSFFIFDGDDQAYVNGKFAFAVRSFRNYEKLFSPAKSSQKIGEMSTPYLYLYEKAIVNIKKYFPDYRKIKIVILLRNPADRAFSQYLWRVRDGREPLSFEEAVNGEEERMRMNYSFDYFYVDRGYYFKQVKAYLENFNHVKVILFEDLKANPLQVLKELCAFLEVDDSHPFSLLDAQNESSVPRWPRLSKMVTAESSLKYKFWFMLPEKLRRRIRNLFSRLSSDSSIKPEMSNAMRARLTELYRKDILELQRLLNRDLSSWLR